MINLGSFSGKDMPAVRLRVTVIDRVLEVVAALLMIAILVLVIVHYKEVSGVTKNNLIAFGISTPLLWALFGWSPYAPVRFIRFPFRPTEANIASQCWLVAKLMRVMNIICMLIFLSVVCSSLKSFWGIEGNLFDLLVALPISLMLISMAVYYLFAWRYR